MNLTAILASIFHESKCFSLKENRYTETNWIKYIHRKILYQWIDLINAGLFLSINNTQG